MVGRGIPRDVVRKIEGYGGGKFGKAADPFMVSCSDEGRVEIPSLQLLEGLTPNRISDRNEIRARLDDTLRQLDRAGMSEWDRTYQRAYGLISSPQSRAAFDLTQESQSTRNNYGQTTFGQSCLLARRLVEAGVPYIQVNWSEYVECSRTLIARSSIVRFRRCWMICRGEGYLIPHWSWRWVSSGARRVLLIVQRVTIGLAAISRCGREGVFSRAG